MSRERTVGDDFRLSSLFRFCLVSDLIEADGGFQHQQNIEPLLANLADYPGDLIGLAHRLMDRFAQLLDEFFYLLIQCHLRSLSQNSRAHARLFGMYHSTHWVFPLVDRGNGSCG